MDYAQLGADLAREAAEARYYWQVEDTSRACSDCHGTAGGCDTCGWHPKGLVPGGADDPEPIEAEAIPQPDQSHTEAILEPPYTREEFNLALQQASECAAHYFGTEETPGENGLRELAEDLLEAASVAAGYLNVCRLSNHAGAQIKVDQALAVLCAAIKRAEGVL